MPEEKKQFYPKSLAEWRAWLAKNHEKEKFVWLVAFKRHTGKPGLKHRESMEEAICFGWIDTIIKRLDNDRYMRGFAKRTKNSKWSNNTLKYAKELIASGKMTPIGLKAYEEGMKRPTHDHGVPLNPKLPEDLKKALQKGNALEKFNNFAPSYRRTYLRWLVMAKLQETRKKRLDYIVNASLTGKKM